MSMNKLPSNPNYFLSLFQYANMNCPIHQFFCWSCLEDIFFCLQTANSDKLTSFINTLNGKDGNLCHLVTVPPGPLLSDALISSPLLQGEDGAPAGMEYASEYGFDPNSDPELALVSD